MWNTELETIAQRWADQCSFDHDEERCKEDGTDVSIAATKFRERAFSLLKAYTANHHNLLQVGQNVYWTASSVQQTEQGVMADLATAAQDWYDEVTYPGYTFSDPWQ